MDPLTSALTHFETEDAILDPAIIEHYDEYVAAGGDPKIAAEALSAGYFGCSNAIAEIHDWAQLSGSGDQVLQEALMHVIEQHETSLIPAINSNLMKDPEAASTINFLTASPAWSSFMNDMADRNKQTLFYDIVIRQAKLPQVGISSDVLRTPEAFMTEIVDQLNTLCISTTPLSKSNLSDLMKRLSVLCTYDEQTTLVSLRLFAEFAEQTKEPRMRQLCRKISQKIRSEAVQVMTKSSIVPKNIARQYVIRLAINVDCASAGVQIRKSVIDALVTIADSGHRRRFDTEVSGLMREYGTLLGHLDFATPDVSSIQNGTTQTTTEKKVLIQALCHPEVFLDLLKALYSHSCRTYVDGRPEPKKRRCLSLLLAYVSVFVSLSGSGIEEVINSETSRQLICASVKSMYIKLHDSAEACEELIPGSPRAKIKGKYAEVLLNGTKDPMIARGVVLWAKECLQGGADLRSLLKTAPKHLEFLEAVASHHEVLCQDILMAIHGAFTRDYSGLDFKQVNQLRDMFMKTISNMLKLSMGPQVVMTFKQWWVEGGIAKKLYLRNFVTALFRTLSPPYSTSFAAAVKEFLGHDRVLSAIEGDVALCGKVFNFQDVTGISFSKQNSLVPS